MAFQHGHALLVGVGADLPNTVDDANGLASILRDPERCAYPASQVSVLTQEEASRSKVMAGLARLAERTDEESMAIVYFSGHGYFVTAPQGKRYFLMPHGYDLGNLPDTAISDGEFAAALGKLRTRKLLVLLDCCHAGGIERAKAPGLLPAKAPIPPEAEKMLGAGNGRVAIGSSTAEELSFAGEPYSAFTVALIEALVGTGASQKDGYVRVTDLAMYASRRVPELTNKKQHPVLRLAKADDFVVSYYAGGDAQPKGAPFAKPPRIESEGEQAARAAGDFKIINENVTVNGNLIQGRDQTFDFRGATIGGRGRPEQ